MLIKKRLRRVLVTPPEPGPKGKDPVDTTNHTATSTKPDTECFACFEGVVYIGHLVEDEDGDADEVFEPIPCRRCEAR